MRFVGLAYVGIFVIGLGAFRQQTGTEAPPTLTPPDPFASAPFAQILPEIAPEPIRADEALVAQSSEAARSQERSWERSGATVAPQVPPRRTRRRRSRNRYPGRIPTPDEWTAPEGPVRIALQAGHWRADEAPRELRGLRNNGTSWRGTSPGATRRRWRIS